jgi:hypothetical protein
VNSFNKYFTHFLKCNRPRNTVRADKRFSKCAILAVEQLDDRCLPSSSPLTLASNHNLDDGSKVVLQNVEVYQWCSTTNMGFALQQGGVLDDFTYASPTKLNATIGSNVESFGLSSDGTLYELMSGGQLQDSTNSGISWSVRDTQAESFGVSTSDILYDMEIGGELRYSSNRGSTWSILDYNSESIAVTSGGTLYNQLSGGVLESSTNSGKSWTSLDTTTESFSVTTSGTLYDLETGGKLKDLASGGAWKTLDTNTQSFAVTPGNTLYNLLTGGTLKSSTNTGSSWSTIDSAVQEYSIAANGALYLADTGGVEKELSYAGSSWLTLGNSVQSFSLLSNGTLFDLQSGGLLEYSIDSGNTWTTLDTDTQSFAVTANGTLYDLADSPDSLWVTTDLGNWWPWIDSNTQSFAVSANGSLFNLLTGGVLEYSNDAGNSWSTLDTATQAFAVSGDGTLYDLADNPGVLWSTTNLGYNWNWLDSNTQSFEVGADGTLYNLLTGGVLEYSNNAGSSWNTLDTATQSFALSGNGMLYDFADAAGVLWSTSNLGSGWDWLDSDTQSFSVGTDGILYNQLTGGLLEYSCDAGSSWNTLDTATQSFAVTGNGTLYDLADSSGMLYTTTDLGNGWYWCDNRTESFSVGDNGTLYKLLIGGVLEYSNDAGNSWTTLDTDTQAFAVSGNGILYNLAGSPAVLSSSIDLGSDWNAMDSNTQSFLVGTNGAFYNLLTGGTLEYSTDFDGSWSSLDSNTQSFAVNASGTVYNLLTNGLLESSTSLGSTWSTEDTNTHSFALGSNGAIYNLLTNGQPEYSTDFGYSWNANLDTASQFTQSFAVTGSGTIYNLLTNGLLEYTSNFGNSWTSSPYSNVQSFAVSGNSTVYLLAGGQLICSPDFGNTWNAVDSSTQAFAMIANGTIFDLEANGTLMSWGGANNIVDRLATSFSISPLNQLSETDWFNANLPDAGLSLLADSDFARDSAITTNDFIGLLEAVASRGNVTNGELATLNALLDNSALLNIPANVVNQAEIAIAGNPNDPNYPNQLLADLTNGLPPGSTVVPGSWFAENMPDQGLAILAQNDVARDGAITRNDFISLMESVAARGPVTSDELTSLENLLSTSAVSIPEYVQNLAEKAIDGNPANAFYQGENLGNLAVGSSPAQVLDLVGKWFYGTDNPTTDSNPAIGLGYQSTLAGGTLFGNSGVPSYNDVAQGFAADCYFMSSLGQVALQSPSTIENMFTNNGDGTYTVEFYNNGVPDYVTVNGYLPTASDGEFVYANNYQYGQMTYVSSSINVLWVALAEKAYAQLAEEGWSRADPGESSNAYDAIGYGSSLTVMEQITGSTTGQYIQIDGDTPEQLAAAETAVMNALAQNDLVCFGTPMAFGSNNGILPNGEQFDGNHLYAIASYNAQSGLFTLINPYDDGAGTRVIQVDWDTLVQYAEVFQEVTPPPGENVSSIVVDN